MRVRLAVLPPVAGDGRAWIEVTTVGARSLPFAARLLLNVGTGKLERASVYALGQAPIELPVGEARTNTAHEEGELVLGFRKKRGLRARDCLASI